MILIDNYLNFNTKIVVFFLIIYCLIFRYFLKKYICLIYYQREKSDQNHKFFEEDNLNFLKDRWDFIKRRPFKA